MYISTCIYVREWCVLAIPKSLSTYLYVREWCVLAIPMSLDSVYIYVSICA